MAFGRCSYQEVNLNQQVLPAL